MATIYLPEADLRGVIVCQNAVGIRTRINLSDEDDFKCSKNKRDRLQNLLEMIPLCTHRNIPDPSTVAHSRPGDPAGALDSLIEAVEEGELLLSPGKLMPGRMGVSAAAAAWMMERSTLGKSVHAEMTAAGLFDYLKRKRSDSARASMRSHVVRLLASLSMSVNGAKCLADLGPEGTKTWLSFFKSETDAMRWRTDLWGGSEPHYLEALRHICFALSRIFPDQGFEDFGRNARPDFLRRGSHAQTYGVLAAKYPKWNALFEDFRTKNPTVGSKLKGSLHSLISYIHESRDTLQVEDPVAFMTGPRPSTRFVTFLINVRLQNGKKPFSQPVLNSLNHIRRFNQFFELMYPQHRSPLQLVTLLDIDHVKGKIDAEDGGRPPAESVSTPLPRNLYEKTKEILLEGKGGWPGTCSLCYIFVDGERTYCPVLPTLYLALFEIPLRAGQTKRLDSGEGDLDRFEPTTNRWIKNKGPHRGHWVNAEKKRPHRGFAARMPNSKLTGIFVNTNKTGKPFVIPWQNFEFFRLLDELRMFQEKHQPIDAPIHPEVYIEQADNVPKSALSQYPSIFPLFRVPDSRMRKGLYTLPNNRMTNQFWQFLMAELERRHNIENPDDPLSIVNRPEKYPNGQPHGAVFKPHGMRVAGITALAEAGVPITIISKFVAGHDTILMTLYYYHLRPELIHQLIAEVLIGVAWQPRQHQQAEQVNLPIGVEPLRRSTAKAALTLGRPRD
ncbi:VPA1269 family protein [Antarcticirhabdus aurantiaca]|uniref:VPA1269 family protein n=1 Tax=Antarcticirhabdus aurantiaca TaxID=2606717 RepID=A0ACD4NQ45_9HYPH|nr:VPA1269 family protein [Antarcticirhabdus aurantiaca]WAJ28904.1 VPA1269 family protein [Jeongeuplla avenae]